MEHSVASKKILRHLSRALDRFGYPLEDISRPGRDAYFCVVDVEGERFQIMLTVVEGAVRLSITNSEPKFSRAGEARVRQVLEETNQSPAFFREGAPREMPWIRFVYVAEFRCIRVQGTLWQTGEEELGHLEARRRVAQFLRAVRDNWPDIETHDQAAEGDALPEEEDL